MVIHFFELKMTHLSLGMINSFCFHFDVKRQGFCIYCQDESSLLFGTREEEEEKYKKCFEKNKISYYKFLNGEKALFAEIKKETKKNNLCVLHGYYPFVRMFRSLGVRLDLLSRIVHVNWGGGTLINKELLSFRGRLGLFRRKFYFSRLKYIVVLAESDKFVLEKNYGIKNILVASYLFIPQKIDMSFKVCVREEKSKVKVMLSHSGHIYNNHIKALTLLKDRYDLVIEEVSSPLCYGPKDYIEEVINVGKELFGDRFSFFTDLLSKDDYVKYIRDKDIYVTASPIQSGLFACSIALGNGLKVFCGESNYDSFKDYIIYKFDDLKCLPINDFISPLSEEEVKYCYNKTITDKFATEKVSIWNDIFFEDKR